MRYSCSELYMMSEKAKLFGDQVSGVVWLRMIPANIANRCGVRPFDHAECALRREDIILNGTNKALEYRYPG